MSTPWWVGKQYKCEGYGRSTDCYALAEIQFHGYWLCQCCYENAIASNGVFRAVALAIPPRNWRYDPREDFSYGSGEHGRNAGHATHHV